MSIGHALKMKVFNAVCSLFESMGFLLIRRHFYQPIPDRGDLSDDFYGTMSDMVGVELNESQALSFFEQVLPPYLEEFRNLFPCHPEQGKGAEPGFHLINGSFMAVDAHLYYALIRHNSPRRIIEIGGGNSSVLAAIACQQNLRKGQTETRLTIIEPYPDKIIRNGFPGMNDLIESKVQRVEPAIFEQLVAGDILFIDSSHVLRSGGDVQYEYLEILPRLAPGVLVHVHDISLPKPYPKVYAENRLFWNEQYLLQAFLTYNSRFEVIWPGNYMMLKYPEKMCQAFPEFATMRNSFPQSEPTSFWMRVKP
jgi:hypothetical protein